MHYQCLIVEDEVDLAKATCEYFELFDVACTYVTEPAACLEVLGQNSVDVLLLDINLADESGFTLCKKIREKYDMPILFISARQSDEDILLALNIGGDDYIKKPYTLSVLLAKVKAVLKRLTVNTPVEKAGSQSLILHDATRSVEIRGKKVELKAKEYRLLQCLYEKRNTIVTKEQLFDEVWGDAFFSDGTLNVHIRKLREKLEENPDEPTMIKTVWGTGYILEVNSEQLLET